MLGLTAVLCLGAIAAIAFLQDRYGEDRNAELRLERARAALTQLQSVPHGAIAPSEDDSRYARQETRFAHQEMVGGIERVDGTLADLAADRPPAELADLETPLRKNYDVLEEIFRLRSTVGFVPEIDRLGQRAGRLSGRIETLFRAAGDAYHQRAAASRTQSLAGSGAAILVLFGAFALFHGRSGRLQRANELLLEASRREALTDSLTGLGNRRALVQDLERVVRDGGESGEQILAIFDLNGFKQYNDRFGHPAGDVLLKRLAARLRDLTGPGIRAYRMGGDEFCMLVDLAHADETVLANAAEALSESGEDYAVGCSHGAVAIPREARTASEGLRIADQRMYVDKGARWWETKAAPDEASTPAS